MLSGNAVREILCCKWREKSQWFQSVDKNIICQKYVIKPVNVCMCTRVKSKKANIYLELEFSTPIVSGTFMCAAQYSFECLPKFGTENCVYYGIQRWITVAHPEEEWCNRIINVTTFAQWQQECHNEKWQPAHNECTRDNGKCFGSFTFTFRLKCFLTFGNLWRWYTTTCTAAAAANSSTRLRMHWCWHLTNRNCNSTARRWGWR